MEDNKQKLYDIYLNYSYDDLMKLFKNAKTKEEQDFYVTLSNLVLQREAKKVIGKWLWQLIQSLEVLMEQEKHRFINQLIMKK